ncbi:1-phosphatidylinositol-3-phosphate 5-kinase [Elysia marginata]|uniref:1-phosphatidylinositol-3-phosphate 5-kinase n=1 Tax=Elysia marginata TaxID=1093978 RepID=A0AAV4F5B9_9GAST|nr:1-phosphatidylinositol-3-phosphate 5-kinase [Elysia marginata]
MPTIREEQERNEPLWFQEIEQKGNDSNSTNESPAPDSEARSIEASGDENTLKSSQEEMRIDPRRRESRGSSFSELPKLTNMMPRDMEEPLPRQDSSFHGLGEDFLKGAVFLGRPQVATSIACPTGWRNVDQLREENGERLAYERLKKAHTELWHVLTRQLLSQNSLLLSWETIISSVITQVSHFVRPDVRCEADDMDIRNYVHIKKVPGGQKSETSLFHGVILTKNVAHKKMRTKITNPLILLLRGTIEFQRVENKFSSLEPQILQEREFMRHCVMKMVAYKPNVVVVEKSVSRLAQEFLLEEGITLLYNVKLSVMERLARFTQAHIVSSIDGLVSKPNMGFCHDFRVQTYTLPNKETKTLTFFDGCATHLGCTVLLSGGTFSELRRVKQIVKFMTYTAYNSLLELCFCMDEFALPQPGADEIGQPFEALESSLTSTISDAPTSSAGSASGRDSMSKEDHPFNWSIKAEELPGKDEPGSGKFELSIPDGSDGSVYSRGRTVTEDDYVFEDGEDEGESVDGNLLEGEERRKALEMAEVRKRASGAREATAPTDNTKRHGRWYSESVPSIEVSDETERPGGDLQNGGSLRGAETAGDCDSIGDVFEDAEEQLTNGPTSGLSLRRDCVISSNMNAGHFSKANKDGTETARTSTDPALVATDKTAADSNPAQKPSDSTLSQSEVKFGLSDQDLLPVVEHQPQKHLRLSSRSVDGISPDVTSDRSTPEIFPSDNPLWDGNPKRVGNIVCVIPKSAMPYVPVTSSSASLSPGKDDKDSSGSKRKLKSTSGLQNASVYNSNRAVSLDAENLAKQSGIEHKLGVYEETGQGTSSLDTGVNSGKKETSEETNRGSHGSSASPSQLSKGGLKVPISRTISETSSYSSKQSSTSKLTELTDGSDPLLGYQNTRDESIFHADASRTLKEIKQTRYKLFRRALDGVHLTVSPYHKFHVPFIETDKGAKCAVRKYLPPNVFWSPLFDDESDGGKPNELSKLKKAADLEKKRDKVLADSALSVEVLGSGPSSKAMLPKSNVQLLHAHPLITCNLTEPIWDLDTQSVLADFRARGGRILVPEQTNGKQARIIAEANLKKLEESSFVDNATGKSGPLWAKRIDCLDVMNHQRLNVLFSSYSYKSNNHPFPCVYPWVVSMDFYGRNDITLGGFLERFCFRLQYSCPSPTCDTPMMDHIRRFVHGNASINVLLKHLDSEVPGARDNILMWSWCRKCKQVTPVVPISSDTWSLSFAKYLDLRFHASGFLRRATAEPCCHSLHHDHFQYFGHRNIVASFKYAPISLRELALPMTVVSMEPPIFDPENLADAVKMITYKAMDRYSLMLESTMKLKQEMTSDVQTRTIGDFLAEQQGDKKSFRDSATNIQMKIQELIFSVTCLVENGQTDSDMTCHLFSIFDNVELLKRHICADVLKWNNK